MQGYFLSARPQYGPLFSFESGRCLTRAIVSDLLRDSARVAGLPYYSLKGHSFRIGAASVAADASLPDWLIKVLSRWSSDCYQLYSRTPQSTLESGSQDGYCSWTLPANSSFRFFSPCLFVLLFGLKGMHCLACISGMAVKSAQRLPLSVLAALPFNIACKRILLSDPARAVCSCFMADYSPFFCTD